jgi:Tfp pilus assembly protein PilF
MANIYVTRGDLAGAMGMYEQSLKIDESLGDQKGKSATLHQMANIYVTRGDLAGAMGLYEQSLKISDSLGDQQGKAATLHAMANIYVTRGDLAGAMGLYEQSLKIDESLGDQQGKAVTLHAMAYILRVRGDLAGAMGLYEQSLKIKESLEDQKGKAMTLGMLGQVLWAQKRYETALQNLWGGLSILVELKIEPQTQQAMAQTLAAWRQEIGAQVFDPLWEKVAGGSPPEWLAAAGEQGNSEQSLSLEQWINLSVQAAHSHSLDVEPLSQLARHAAADPDLPAEVQNLAGVLQRILAGDMHPDLSSLTPELAALVRAALEEQL